MARKKSVSRKKATSRKKAAVKGAKVPMKPQTRKALQQLEADGRPVHVLGRIRNGKLEIDQNSLEEATRRFPNANWAFVAMNAPFDPAPYCAQ